MVILPSLFFLLCVLQVVGGEFVECRLRQWRSSRFQLTKWQSSARIDIGEREIQVSSVPRQQDNKELKELATKLAKEINSENYFSLSKLIEVSLDEKSCSILGIKSINWSNDRFCLKIKYALLWQDGVVYFLEMAGIRVKATSALPRELIVEKEDEYSENLNWANALAAVAKVQSSSKIFDVQPRIDGPQSPWFRVTEFVVVSDNNNSKPKLTISVKKMASTVAEYTPEGELKVSILLNHGRNYTLGAISKNALRIIVDENKANKAILEYLPSIKKDIEEELYQRMLDNDCYNNNFHSFLSIIAREGTEVISGSDKVYGVGTVNLFEKQQCSVGNGTFTELQIKFYALGSSRLKEVQKKNVSSSSVGQEPHPNINKWIFSLEYKDKGISFFTTVMIDLNLKFVGDVSKCSVANSLEDLYNFKQNGIGTLNTVNLNEIPTTEMYISEEIMNFATRGSEYYYPHKETHTKQFSIIGLQKFGHIYIESVKPNYKPWDSYLIKIAGKTEVYCAKMKESSKLLQIPNDLPIRLMKTSKYCQMAREIVTRFYEFPEYPFLMIAGPMPDFTRSEDFGDSPFIKWETWVTKEISQVKTEDNKINLKITLDKPYEIGGKNVIEIHQPMLGGSKALLGIWETHEMSVRIFNIFLSYQNIVDLKQVEANLKRNGYYILASVPKESSNLESAREWKALFKLCSVALETDKFSTQHVTFSYKGEKDALTFLHQRKTDLESSDSLEEKELNKAELVTVCEEIALLSTEEKKVVF